MAGESRTCTNCGNQQVTGDYCERCGTRLPETVVGQQATTQQSASPAYRYPSQAQAGVPRFPGPFSRLFDLSFQGFIKRDSLRTVFTTTLAILGAYWFFALIFGIVAAAKFDPAWCIGIFSSLLLVSLLIIWTRVMMELAMSMSKMQEDMARVAEAAEASKTQAQASATNSRSAQTSAKNSSARAAGSRSTASRGSSSKAAGARAKK